MYSSKRPVVIVPMISVGAVISALSAGDMIVTPGVVLSAGSLIPRFRDRVALLPALSAAVTSTLCTLPGAKFVVLIAVVGMVAGRVGSRRPRSG